MQKGASAAQGTAGATGLTDEIWTTIGRPTVCDHLQLHLVQPGRPPNGSMLASRSSGSRWCPEGSSILSGVSALLRRRFFRPVSNTSIRWCVSPQTLRKDPKWQVKRALRDPSTPSPGSHETGR